MLMDFRILQPPHTQQTGTAGNTQGNWTAGYGAPSRQDRPGRPIRARPIYQVPLTDGCNWRVPTIRRSPRVRAPYPAVLPTNYRPPVSPVKPRSCVVSVTRGPSRPPDPGLF